jgi:fumarate reductase subunit D
MKKLTVFGVILAVILLGIYANEAYNLFTTLWLNTNPAINGIGGAIAKLLANYPWWWLLCTIGGVVCGVLAPILYFFYSPHAEECAYSALSLKTLAFVLNACFRQSWATVFAAGGGRTWLFTVVVAILTLMFAVHLSNRREYIFHSNTHVWKFLGSK